MQDTCSKKTSGSTKGIGSFLRSLFLKQKVCLRQSFYPLRQIAVYEQIVAETSGKTEAVKNFVQTEVRMPVVKDRKL